MNLRWDAASRSTPIDQACEAVLIDEHGNEYPLPCGLAYDAHDPYAVSLTLRGAEREVTWVFARSLLAHGAFEPAGEADVHVWPTVAAHGQARVAIELVNQGVTALVLVPAHAVVTFLLETESLVPCGTESAVVDLDAEIAALLRAR